MSDCFTAGGGDFNQKEDETLFSAALPLNPEQEAPWNRRRVCSRRQALPDREENGSPIGKRKESPILRTQVGKEAKIHRRVSMNHCRTPETFRKGVWGAGESLPSCFFPECHIIRLITPQQCSLHTSNRAMQHASVRKWKDVRWHICLKYHNGTQYFLQCLRWHICLKYDNGTQYFLQNLRQVFAKCLWNRLDAEKLTKCLNKSDQKLNWR